MLHMPPAGQKKREPRNIICVEKEARVLNDMRGHLEAQGRSQGDLYREAVPNILDPFTWARPAPNVILFKRLSLSSQDAQYGALR